MPPPSSESDTEEESGVLEGAFESKTETNADTSTANRGALLEGEEVKFNARVPENLRDAFQDVCESEGRSMSWVIRQWMVQAVEEGETGLFKAPMFDERHFPYEFECEGCSATATVTHEDIQDVPSYLATSTVAEAVEYVMTNRRGWSVESIEGALCPDCADGRF